MHMQLNTIKKTLQIYFKNENLERNNVPECEYSNYKDIIISTKFYNFNTHLIKRENDL